MPRFEYSVTREKYGQWLADHWDLDNFLTNGAKLKVRSIPIGNEGVSTVARFLPSGSLLGRTANSKKYELVPNTASPTSTNATVTTADVNGATSIVVEDTDGFVAGNAITVSGTAATIDSVNTITKTIVLTGALGGGAKAAGAAVVLATPVAFAEYYLCANGIGDVIAGHSDEVTLLRHQRRIYENYLPRWATMDAALKTIIRARYQCEIGNY